MYRYKIILEYLGTGFAGWQRQNNVMSVQGLIEEAIYQFSAEKVNAFCSGRTDAGVHALGQVAHFDLSKYYEPHRVMYSINYFMRPNSVGVVDCSIVDNEFHARFSAKYRHYMYRIINRPSNLVVDFNRAWWIKNQLDLDSMQSGAEYLIGHHDFTSFRASECQAKSAMKTLTSLVIKQESDEIRIYASAPSFLHHMVRNIVGSLTKVGLNEWKPSHMKEVLEAKNREAAGITAPACGLYFLKVDY